MDPRSVLCFFGIMLAGTPLRAQFTARADLVTATRYVWHGLSRSGGAVTQFSSALGRRFGPLTVEGGTALHFEWDRVRLGELSETGVGKTGLGEVDFWGGLALDLGPVRFQAGAVRYLFQGTSAAGGLGSDHNTTELYAAVSVFRAYSNPTAELWWDVRRVRGAYLSLSGRTPMLAWPLQPFIFVYVDAEAGLNLGQAPDPGRPQDLANFSERGLTHAALGFTLSTRLKHMPGLGFVALTGGARSQLNLDEATRFDGLGRRDDIRVWFWGGLSLALGGVARTLR